MYKVGVMMMGKPQNTSPKKVREVILEVQAKTKILNIFQYLLELQKITNMNKSISIQKGGQYINETSTISQVLKYTRPVNGVIKLYLYDIDQNETLDKLVLKPSRHETNNPEAYQKTLDEADKNKELLRKQQREKQKQEQRRKAEGSSGICCCC